jgi:microcystin-dependent protein
MSYFLANGHSAVPPPGSIMPYIGGGETKNGVNPGDPDGWVICDGEPRTATDNRFSNVFTILNTYAYSNITNNTANSITPPNLTSKFIYGQSSSETQTYSEGGAASVPLTISNLPSHDIDVTARDTGHSHYIQQDNLGNINLERLTFGSGGTNGQLENGTQTGYANITASGSYTNNNLQNVNTLPPYVAMNYIMKY